MGTMLSKTYLKSLYISSYDQKTRKQKVSFYVFYFHSLFDFCPQTIFFDNFSTDCMITMMEILHWTPSPDLSLVGLAVVCKAT